MVQRIILYREMLEDISLIILFFLITIKDHSTTLSTHLKENTMNKKQSGIVF